MELAKRGRSDDKVASGWGKIRAKIRQIEASWAPSGQYSLTLAAFRWEWQSVAPTLMTANFSKPPSTVCRSIGPSLRVDISMSVSTKAMTQKTSARFFADAIINRKSNLADKKSNKKRITRDSKHDDGLSSELILGSIVFDAC